MAKIEINKAAFEVHKEEHQVLINGEIANYNLIKVPGKKYHLVLDGKSYNIEVHQKNTSSGELTFSINGRTMSSKLHNKLNDLLISMGMERGKKKLKELKAPMPGLVLNIMVSAGDQVAEGQDLIVLEAMKMENAIKSPQAGIIEQVAVSNQDKVEKNQILLVFE